MADIIGTLNKQYVSSVNFLDRPEILSEVLDITSEQRTILDIMEITGRFVTSGQAEFHSFVNSHVFTAGIVADIDPDTTGDDGASAGEDLIIEVTATEGLPVVGENVMLKSGVIGRVSSVTKASLLFTIETLNATDILNASGTAVVATDLCIYFTTSSYEGSTSPDARKPEWNRYTNYVQIFKEKGELTDLQKVAKLEVNYNNSPHVLYKLQHDVLLRHQAKIAFGLVAGQFAKKTDADGNYLYQTQGLLSLIHI